MATLPARLHAGMFCMIYRSPAEEMELHLDVI